MRRISNSIKAIDQVGPQITFKYHDKNRIQTVFGGFLTFLMVVIGTLGFIYFSRDMVFRTNPISKQNTIAADDKRIPFSEYPVSVAIADVYFQALKPEDPLNNSFEIFPQYYISIVEDNNYTLQTGYFGLKPCTKEYFGKFKDLYASTILGGSKCVDYSKSFNLDGTPSNIDAVMYRNKIVSGEGTLDVKLRLCDEEKNPGCSKPFLETGQVQFLVSIPKEMVNFDDYGSPIERQLDFLNGAIVPGLYSRKINHVSVNRLVTDDGFLLSNTSEEEFINTTLFDSSVTYYNPASRNLYAYQFTMTIIEQIFERRYIKIQEILANIGGFMKLLFFVASLLTKHFSLYSFYKTFGKEINDISKEIGKKHRDIPINNLAKPSLDKPGNQSSAEILSSTFKKPQINTEVGFKKFVTSLFSKKKEDNGAELVFKYLDVSFLTESIIKVEMDKNK